MWGHGSGRHATPKLSLACTGTVPGQAMAVPEAALLAAAAITGDMPARHAGQAPSERSELESLMATLLCR